MTMNLVNTLLAWPRWLKRFVVLLLDISLCIITTVFAFYLRLGVWVTPWGQQSTPDLLVSPGIVTILAIVISIPLFILFGLYREIFRYSGWAALLTILKAVVLQSILFIGIFTIVGVQGVPRTIGLIQPLLLLFFVGASRALVSYWFSNAYRYHLSLGKIPRSLIYGAGEAGRELAKVISGSRKVQIVGYIDDNLSFQGRILNGLRVYQPEKISELINKYQITEILLAIPSLNRVKRNEIINNLSKYNIAVHTLPSIQDLALGKISFSDIKDLDIEDLLGRDPVAPDMNLITKHIRDKVILITGAGGSIGSELCYQVIKLNPKKIILFEQNELALYKIEQILRKHVSKDFFSTDTIVPILGSVLDKNLVKKTLTEFMPHIIFHAAAYKHVPLVENNPSSGIYNNVFGTKIIAQQSAEMKIPNFVLISTDKAVRPTNIMGASKRIAEMVVQAFADKSKLPDDTIFSMVRFGNVLNSSGSVIPLFQRQIKEGGPLTVTHPEVTRFFMMIPEASQLVMQASAMAKGGDVFVLDMGKPLKIIDLAIKMVRLSGLQIRDESNPNGDIDINFIGLRPGEKLYEELLIGNNPMPTEHASIFKANEELLSLDELDLVLSRLEKQLPNLSSKELQSFLKNLVKDYQPS